MEIDSYYYSEVDDEYEYMDGHTYKSLHGKKAWDELYNAWMVRWRNIVIQEFTNRLSDISGEVKKQLYDAFTNLSAFDVRVHNKLLDTLAHPEHGWNLNDYDY